MSTPPAPSEQVRRYLESLPPMSVDWSDVRELRRRTREEALAVRGALEPVAVVETVDIDGVTARLYRPSGGEREILVWLHGGGWIFGDLDGYDGVARALANRAGCAVVSVDYRLAPEFPFPAGFADAWTLTEWAVGNFSDVAVGGDSSGGNLTAAVALKARESGVDLAAQLLVYPVLDSCTDTRFKRQFRERYSNFAGQAGFGRTSYDRIEHIWETYVPELSFRQSPFASPSRARSLRGLAPVVLVTAEHDILLGEVEEYAGRLRADGVPVTHFHYPGQIHGFFQMLGVMDDAHEAVGSTGSALRDMFISASQQKSRILR